jgi:hypothetical protein
LCWFFSWHNVLPVPPAVAEKTPASGVGAKPLKLYFFEFFCFL